MQKHLLLAATLLAAALAPAAASEPDLDVSDGCVQYMYVADYHWYWVCVDTKGGTCAVYFKEQHGATVTKTCPLGDAVVAVEKCHLVAQDLDYRHYVCVDPSDPKCPVYTKRTDGSHTTTSCPGDLGGATVDAPTVKPEPWCIPTSGGLDYHSYLCVDAGNPECPVYTLHHNDRDGIKKTCYPGLP